MIFLVDTQADISILKKSSFDLIQKYNDSETLKIRGITNNILPSLGTIHVKLFMNNFAIEHKFHLVSDSVNIPTDGIIGKDFLKCYNCNICYESMRLSFIINNIPIYIKIHEGPDDETIVLPARSEVIRKIKISYTNQPQFIDSQEIENGILVARTIIDTKNPYVRILNTTENVKIIKNNTLKSEDLSHYNVYKTKNVECNEDRNKKVQEILKNKMPHYIINKLLPLCLEFSDIFALEDDRMTVNNFYEQSFKLNDNTRYM